jgi:hypothetical protein
MPRGGERRIQVPLEFELTVVALANLAKDRVCVEKMRKVSDD